jgi:hypothetical protein
MPGRFPGIPLPQELPMTTLKTLIAASALLTLASAAEAKTFDAIYEVTLLNQTLPDGKHPVKAFYIAGSDAVQVQVQVPSLDMCVMGPRSTIPSKSNATVYH